MESEPSPAPFAARVGCKAERGSLVMMTVSPRPRCQPWNPGSKASLLVLPGSLIAAQTHAALLPTLVDHSI